MKLKPIEDGMVVHVTSEEDAKTLIKWAYKCGWKWLTSAPSDVTEYQEDICYIFNQSKNIVWDSKAYYTPERIIEFSDLIIPEEEENLPYPCYVTDKKEEHMTAEEILKWLNINEYNRNFSKVFGYEYSISDLLQKFSPQEIISKIEAYESEKKEPKVEWVYSVKYKDDFGNISKMLLLTEQEAIAQCEKLVKNVHIQKAWYEKICREKPQL